MATVGMFSTRTLAEHLEIDRKDAWKIIKHYKARGLVVKVDRSMRGSGSYRLCPTKLRNNRPPNTGAKVDRIWNVATMLRRFNIRELAQLSEQPIDLCKKYVKSMLDQGVVKDVGKTKGIYSKPAHIYVVLSMCKERPAFRKVVRGESVRA